MKDSDITKALECCAQSRTRNDCEKLHCPACENIGCYFINQSDEDNLMDALVEGLCIQALDLINRKNAEIETLQEVIFKKEELAQILHKEHQETVDELQYAKAEIERLKGWQDLLKAEKHTLIKSEAIKEFVEKVNREITEAIISNDDAITEREKKHGVNRYEDNFCAMCEGKIIALGGIKSFINDLVKERLGE